MGLPPISAAEERDRSLQLLRDLTYVFAVGGLGLLGLFAIVAATTIPGHSDAGPTASTNASDSTFSGDDQFQRPTQGSFGPGSGAPIVVSGGSR
jgi:hypothetical protein